MSEVDILNAVKITRRNACTILCDQFPARGSKENKRCNYFMNGFAFNDTSRSELEGREQKNEV